MAKATTSGAKGGGKPAAKPAAGKPAKGGKTTKK
jgi:hypothetical protein